MGIVSDESVTGAECSRKVASGRRVAGAISSLVNARGLQLECDSLVPVLMNRVGESLSSIVGGQGVCIHIILVLCECI